MKIFCATTGRSGTKFMASVFGYLTDIPSFHEARPHCIAQVSKEINNDCVSGESQKIIEEKITGVRHYENYFESNNMFIKSFVWPFLDVYDDLFVIYLHRNPLDVFLSHAERNFKMGLDWFLQPQWKRNFMRSERSMGFLELINWNWYEVRERFLRLKKYFIKTYDFDFRKLNDLNEYYGLFQCFGIKHRKVDALPDFEKNTNTGISVTERYSEIIRDINSRWDESGIEWMFRGQ